MKKTPYFFILVCIAIMASCSPYQYHTTRVVNTDFSEYKTYGWLPPVDSLSKSYFNNDIAQHNIMEQANIELENRGLTYTKEEPDLLFRYITIVNNKSRPLYAPAGGYYGYGPWGWGMWGMPAWGWGAGHYPVGTERYRASHIIIEARDRRKNTVIWQARGTGTARSPEKAINDLPGIISGVMKEFPITAPKKSK